MAELPVYGELHLLEETCQGSIRKHSQHPPANQRTIHGHEREFDLGDNEIGNSGTTLTGYDSEAWRYTGPFTRYNRFRGSFPGLGIATVAFAVYCGYEYMFLKDEHHEDGHAGAHH